LRKSSIFNWIIAVDWSVRFASPDKCSSVDKGNLVLR
jgi:hypothetical protein